ncbi:hypothetical protein Q8W71_31815 [Methylobacterium sp. NEAU 140]|uniref:hypothetical protein n=1 Tax=Methylobacterium sp. NEAU 140 TaxID=3064945 RepID=UPI002733C659|nr:hypothetical protein [Methylobacterium sp. NEAU 140]MDP4027168.1 hypothetical protein [Methylobacterium sp. NEAU 140]
MTGTQAPAAGRILLVDDDENQLKTLAAEVTAALDGEVAGSVTTWLPDRTDDVERQFSELAQGATLVVTDYDLTRGQSGFFGVSIVAWCQRAAIPVGDYSRGNATNLPAPPNLFGFRFPPETDEAAREIKAVYGGFREIDRALEDRPSLLEMPSPASMLADMLGHPSAVTQFSLYMPPIGAYGGLADRLRATRGQSAGKERRVLWTYVLGHVLFNFIMRYPGPILDVHALCSYLAVSDDEADRIKPLFDGAQYEGPFSTLRPSFWRDRIDDMVETWALESELDYTGHLPSYRRALVEEKLGAALGRYPCPRCEGDRGGFRCPFTKATVCERDDCSVGSSGWIPQGADLSRVERTFFDETSPMLGS